MQSALILTFIAADRPGLVEQLSALVSAHGGNWLESRMSRLAGQFAGIARISLPQAQVETLRASLRELEAQGWICGLHAAGDAPAGDDSRTLALGILGPDRPGIVHEVSAALNRCGINVIEMNTHIGSAPMSAEALFEAQAHIQLPASIDIEALAAQLDAIGERLGVEIDLG